jgi:molecular chaperone Hsp33
LRRIGLTGGAACSIHPKKRVEGNAFHLGGKQQSGCTTTFSAFDILPARAHKRAVQESQNTADAGHEIATDFVRHRNVLIARGGFSELYVDYYLHLAEHGLRNADMHDSLFKEALALFTLHCASRPPNETIAWTLHFQEPFVNLFLGGDTEESIVTGRVFADDVKEMESSRFYADVARPRQELQRSMVPFGGGGAFAAVEAFYAKSEQLPARCFDLGDEHYAIAFAHPDCDMPWFESLKREAIAKLGETETVVPMERRMFRWRCGCNERKILEVLAPLMRKDPEGLFGDLDSVQVNCPRCAARYTVARATLEAFIAGNGRKSE